LKWNDQVATAKVKAYSALGLLKRTFRHWDINGFRTLYTTFVRPNLKYCAQAWNPHLKQDVESLEAVQRHATRLVPSLRRLDYASRLRAFGISTLEERRKRGDLIQFFKVENGFNHVAFLRANRPAPALGCDDPASRVRGCAHRLEQNLVTNCAIRANFFTNRVINDWNELPKEAVEARSLNSFKNKLDKFISNKNSSQSSTTVGY
jgi:ribonuclease P/MRP protein subunit RPP40